MRQKFEQRGIQFSKWWLNEFWPGLLAGAPVSLIFNPTVVFLVVFSASKYPQWEKIITPVTVNCVMAFCIAIVMVGLFFLRCNTVWTKLGWFMRLLTPFCIGFLACVVYANLHRGGDDSKLLQKLFGTNAMEGLLIAAAFSENYKEPFYTAISTLFAIITGLALVRGLESSQKLARILDSEASAAASCLSYARYFELNDLTKVAPESATAIKQFRRQVVTYIQKVASSRFGLDNADPELDIAHEQLQIIRPKDKDDSVAYPRMIDKFEELLAHRTERISTKTKAIPNVFILALCVMAFALVLPFMAEPLCISKEAAFDTLSAQQRERISTNDLNLFFQDKFDPKQYAELLGMPLCRGELLFNPSRWSQYFMIGTLSAFFAMVLLFLYDLQSPFTGFWSIEPTSHIALADKADEMLSQPAKSVGPSDDAVPDGGGKTARGGESGVPDQIDAIRKQAPLPK